MTRRGFFAALAALPMAIKAACSQAPAAGRWTWVTFVPPEAQIRFDCSTHRRGATVERFKILGCDRREARPWL